MSTNTLDGNQALPGTIRILTLILHVPCQVGTGHSIVTTRFAYLNTTFWSHRRLFPHIGVCVGTKQVCWFMGCVVCGVQGR